MPRGVTGVSGWNPPGRRPPGRSTTSTQSMMDASALQRWTICISLTKWALFALDHTACTCPHGQPEAGKHLAAAQVLRKHELSSMPTGPAAHPPHVDWLLISSQAREKTGKCVFVPFQVHPACPGPILLLRAHLQVDCTAEVNLCREHFIQGFPSIRVFRKSHDDIYIGGVRGRSH